MRRGSFSVTVLRAKAALERAGLARRRPVQPPTIAFLDLTGYTRLTEERGDRAAAELAGRLVEIVHELAHRYLMHRLHCSPTIALSGWPSSGVGGNPGRRR
jgi:class 3 adenylate cyclase